MENTDMAHVPATPASKLNSVLRRKTAIKRLLANLIQAEIAYSWAGVADPDDKPYLAEEVKEARRNFDRAINKMLELDSALVLKENL